MEHKVIPEDERHPPHAHTHAQADIDDLPDTLVAIAEDAAEAVAAVAGKADQTDLDAEEAARIAADATKAALSHTHAQADITNLTTDLAAKASTAYVDAAIAGLAWKQSVRAATTVAGTLASSFENGDTIDGVVLATGNRILIKTQADPTENGIYVVAASGTPARASDADSAADIRQASVYVEEGTTLADTQWTMTANAPITIGATNLTWAQLSSGGGVTGSGTPDVLPKWSSSSALGDSALTEASDKITSTKPLILPAGTTSIASLRAPHGSAPTSPVDGDIWTTSAGMFIQINGVTYGPLGTGGGGSGLVRPTVVQYKTGISDDSNLTLASTPIAGNMLVWISCNWDGATLQPERSWNKIEAAPGASTDGFFAAWRKVHTGDTTTVERPWVGDTMVGNNSVCYEIQDAGAFPMLFDALLEKAGTVHTLTGKVMNDVSLLVGAFCTNGSNEDPTITGASEDTFLAGTASNSSPRGISPFHANVERGQGTVVATYGSSRTGSSVGIVIPPAMTTVGGSASPYEAVYTVNASADYTQNTGAYGEIDNPNFDINFTIAGTRQVEVAASLRCIRATGMVRVQVRDGASTILGPVDYSGFRGWYTQFVGESTLQELHLFHVFTLAAGTYRLNLFTLEAFSSQNVTWKDRAFAVRILTP